MPSDDARMRVYLSASIGNAAVNDLARAALAGTRYELVLPQDFTPDVPPAHLPQAIYDRCIEEMRACDLALLLLDGFGVDCAMEVGFLHATGRPVVGVVAANTRFLRHWMVKGGLDAFVCLDAALGAPLAADPIVGGLPLAAAAGWGELAAALDRVLHSLASREGRDDR